MRKLKYRIGILISIGLMILGFYIIYTGLDWEVGIINKKDVAVFWEDLKDAFEMKLLGECPGVVSTDLLWKNSNYRQVQMSQEVETINFDEEFEYTWDTQKDNLMARNYVDANIVSAYGNGPVWHHHNTMKFLVMVNRCDAGDIVIIGGKKYVVESRIKFVDYDDSEIYKKLYTDGIPRIITCWDWDALNLVNQGRRLVQLKEIEE